MKTKLKSIGYVFGVVISAIALGTFLQFAKAWTEPTATPPTQNIGAPINTGIIGQGKAGNFSATGIVASTLLVTGDANISGAGNGIVFADGTKQITATQANNSVSTAGDNLGDHTATKDLDMGGKAIDNVSDITLFFNGIPVTLKPAYANLGEDTYTTTSFYAGNYNTNVSGSAYNSSDTCSGDGTNKYFCVVNVNKDCIDYYATVHSMSLGSYGTQLISNVQSQHVICKKAVSAVFTGLE